MQNSSHSTTLNTFENLYPAILQCFLIILLGYVAGRTHLIAPSQSRGLGNYITYFALPALIFKTMVEVNFAKINWLFWSAILVSKAIVFVIVYVFSLVLGRDFNIGRAGIFAICATQSNDYALGYPIVLAVYNDNYPEFVQYLYLFAPISLAILNPAGFLSMEIQRGSDAPEDQQSRLSMMLRVMKGLATNPVLVMVLAGIVANFAFQQKLPSILDNIFDGLATNPVLVMVLAGIVANFAFQQKLPSILDNIFDVLGSSFSATALFYLGISMIGKSEVKSGYSFIVPALLTAAKLILSPLINRQLVFAMEPGGSDTNMTEALSTLGFLYGTIPSAPSVFLFATYYQQCAAIIAASLVLCTFASAPLMFITATMVMLPVANNQSILQQITFDVSCVGLVSCVWIMLIFLLGCRTRRFPHEFTVQLVLAQLLAVIGIILWVSVKNDSVWLQTLQFVVFLVGELGTRSWTSMVALGLCLVRCRSTCFVMRYRFWFYMYGWGGTLLLVGLLIAASPSDLNPKHVIHMYGKLQLIATSSSLIINCLITSVCLIVLFKYDRYQRGGYRGIPGNDDEETEKLLQGGDQEGEGSGTEDQQPSPDNSSLQCSVTDIEDLSMGSSTIQAQMCANSQDCDGVRRDTCRRRLWVRHLRHLKTADEDYNEAENHQMGRHVILLLLLLLSMIISLFVSLWKLFNSLESGVTLELEFLDIVFNYGQGFFVLATFGFDTKNVILPVITFFRRLFHGVQKIKLPSESDIDPEVQDMCEEFKTQHLQPCRQSIVRDIRHRLQILSNVFYGKELVSWLIQHGVSKDRPEAVTFGQNLLICRVIEHIEQEHNFYDGQLVYKFTIDEFL